MKRRARLGYLLLLAASTGTRLLTPPPPMEDGKKIAVVDSLRIAYRDSDPSSTAPVIVLVHGSPGSGNVLRKLSGMLPGSYRVIVPDLPGFGDSTRDLADYSFRAHARSLLRLLDRLAIRKVHWLAFSMGGGVALSAFDLAPERVLSITMLSAIGVQERELTGSYWANHALHGAQLGLLWGARTLTPHFGWVDRWFLSVEYARNFYDSDQRPLREVLSRYRGPMLILHGRSDRNVPLAAAMEHHRLVPQSELLLFDANHFMAFEQPELFAGPLVEFLNRQGNE